MVTKESSDRPTVAASTARAQDAPASSIRRGRPPRISRQQIIDLALRPDMRFSLNAIAQELGVSSKAVYRHVRDYNDLVREVVLALMRRNAPPVDRGQDWFTWGMENGRLLLLIYTSVPGLAERADAAPLEVPEIFRQVETGLQISARCGHDLLGSLWAMQAVSEFVYSWVIRHDRRSRVAFDTGETAQNVLERNLAAAPTDFPLYRSALSAERVSADERFEFVLRALVLGLQAELSGHSARVSVAAPNTK